MFFRDNLERLLQDKHFKEEIVRFNISEETGVVNASHRATLIPLLMRYRVCFNGFICLMDGLRCIKVKLYRLVCLKTSNFQVKMLFLVLMSTRLLLKLTH